MKKYAEHYKGGMGEFPLRITLNGANYTIGAFARTGSDRTILSDKHLHLASLEGFDVCTVQIGWEEIEVYEIPVEQLCIEDKVLPGIEKICVSPLQSFYECPIIGTDILHYLCFGKDEKGFWIEI